MLEVNAVAPVVIPVFGTAVLGYALARGGLFSAEVGTALVRFMYYLAIPAMLFRILASAELPAEIPWRYLLAFYLPAFATFWLAMRLVSTWFSWQRREEGIAGMSASYSNMVMLGYPLTLAAFGTDAAVPMFILLATQSTFMFPIVTYTTEIGGDLHVAGVEARLRVLTKPMLNPVILSLALGVAANLMGLPLHPSADRILELVGAAGPGCALVALGISLAQYQLGGAYRTVVVLVGLKNFVFPAAVWTTCRLLAIEGVWLHVAVLLAVMPTGVNAFIFSSRYGIRQRDVSNTIVVSTVVSSIVATGLLGMFMR